MRLAIIDYGMGNLGSVARAFEQLGADVGIADDPTGLDSADRILLPGVGSFADGMRHLREGGWQDAIWRHTGAGTPLLGICLGMQLLASEGIEGSAGEPVAGLGLVPGRIVHLDTLACRERLPHVGWNELRLHAGTDNPAAALLDGIPDGTDFYFVHSYGYVPEQDADVLANVAYGVTVPAVVGRGHVMGTQFHPEKSSRAGLRILKNFLEFAC